ncbi:hypothetical protein ACQJBY_007171 [Aegilops geniculata]
MAQAVHCLDTRPFDDAKLKPFTLATTSRSPSPHEVVRQRSDQAARLYHRKPFTFATGGRRSAKDVVFFFSTCYVCFLVRLLGDSMSNFPSVYVFSYSTSGVVCYALISKYCFVLSILM